MNILHIFKIGSGGKLHSEKLQNRNPHFHLRAISISKLGKTLVIVNCKGVYKYVMSLGFLFELNEGFLIWTKFGNFGHHSAHCLDLDLNGKRPGVSSDGNFS